MKEFDLEAAKAGAKLQTRDGRQARIVCYDVNNKDYPLIVLITNKENNKELPYLYTIDGRNNINYINQDDFDLVIAPQTYIKYSNFYRDTNGNIWNGVWYDTIEKAKDNVYYDNVEDSEYITTLEIEISY